MGMGIKKLLLGMSIVFGILAFFACSGDDEGVGEPVIDDTPPVSTVSTADGTGDLATHEDIAPTVIPETATYEDDVVQEFVALYVDAIKNVSSLPRGLRGVKQRALAASSIIDGKNGAVKIGYESETATGYSYESITNEFFDFSSNDSLFLGGSVGYLNTKMKSPNGGTNVTEQADGTIRFAGKFKGEIQFNNVVRNFAEGNEDEAQMMGEFVLVSGNAKIALPNDLLTNFCYLPTEEEVKTIIADTSTAFVAIDSIKAEIPDTIRQGETLRLLASVTPFEATNRKIVWTVKGATIDSLGRVITFGTAGAATITATINGGKSATESYTQTWTVTVIGNSVFVPVRDIQINVPRQMEVQHETFISFEELEFTYGLKVLPETATNKTIEWSAYGATVFSADTLKKGIYFQFENTTATITATIKNGLANGNAPTNADGTRTNDFIKAWTFIVGDSANVPDTTKPETCDTIITNGNIYINCPDDSTGNEFVSVDSIVFIDSYPMATGQANLNNTRYPLETPLYTVYPANATNQSITWSAQGAEIRNGFISFPNEGYIIITAEIANGRLSAEGKLVSYSQSWTVRVTNLNNNPTDTTKEEGEFVPVNSIRINFPTSIQSNTEVPLIYDIISATADGTSASKEQIEIWKKNIVWDVVSENGLQINFDLDMLQAQQILYVLDLKPGETFILTATIPNGTLDDTGERIGYIQSWRITIVNENGGTGTPGEGEFVPVSDIQANFPLEMELGTTIVMDAFAVPETATNKFVEWSANGMQLNGNMFSAYNVIVGDIIALTATIRNGLANGDAPLDPNGNRMNDFVKTWNLTIVGGSQSQARVDSIIAAVPQTIQLGNELYFQSFKAFTSPYDPQFSEQSIVWSAVGADGAPASGVNIFENQKLVLDQTIFAQGGYFVLTATIPGAGELNPNNTYSDYTQSWTIRVITSGDETGGTDPNDPTNPIVATVDSIVADFPLTIQPGGQISLNAKVVSANASGEQLAVWNGGIIWSSSEDMATNIPTQGVNIQINEEEGNYILSIDAVLFQPGMTFNLMARIDNGATLSPDSNVASMPYHQTWTIMVK